MSEIRVALSVIVVNWNTRDLLVQCLQSLEDTVETEFEIWVVDNGSSDGSVPMVQRRFPSTQVIANTENVGFARANNLALARCTGRYIALLNSDTQALPCSLDKVIRFMDKHPSAGLAGVRLLNPDGSFQASFTPFPSVWREFLMLGGLGKRLIHPAFPSRGPQVESGAQRVAGYMEGACLVARREAVDQVGGLDEQLFMYAEDVDWCYRFHRAGWEVWYLPQAPIVHHGGQSSKKRQGRMEAELYRSRVYFFSKHYGKLAALHLKALIYVLTLIKMIVYGLLRLSTGGRRGRSVTAWQDLRAALRRVD